MAAIRNIEPNDDATVRLFLIRTVQALMLGGSVYLLAVLLFAADNWLALLPGPIALIIFGLIGRLLLARGEVRRCMMLIVVGTWCLATGIAAYRGSVTVPIMIIYPPIIILAGWLLGSRAAVSMAALTIFGGLALAVVEWWGWRAPPPTSPPFLHWIVQSVVNILAARVVIFFRHDHDTQVGEAQRLSAALSRKREVELQEANRELEERVAARTADLALREARERDFSQSATDWRWETDAEHRFSYFSDNYEKFFLLDRAEVLGRSRRQLLEGHGEIPPQVLSEHMACLDAHKPFRELEYRLIGRNGSMTWFSVSGVPYFEADGRFAGYRGTGTVINERKAAEAALIRAHDEALQRRSEAERANLAKTEFLSRMSHELRTPLHAILGFAQLLEIAKLSPEDADSVNEIRKAGEHLLTQVNEILDLARIESGRIELQCAPIDVGKAIGNIAARLTPLAKQRGIGIDIDITATGMEVMALADRHRLDQVLLNLLSNAIKYNKDGGRIEVQNTVADRRVRVEIRDTGKGIAAQNLSRLFRPFERIENAYQGIQGTGIGLALVKRLVEAMDGRIGVESALGIGSVFWFTLPLADPGEKPPGA